MCFLPGGWDCSPAIYDCTIGDMRGGRGGVISPHEDSSPPAVFTPLSWSLYVWPAVSSKAEIEAPGVRVKHGGLSWPVWYLALEERYKFTTYYAESVEGNKHTCFKKGICDNSSMLVQHWFRLWLGTEQRTSHHHNQSWHSSLMHIHVNWGAFQKHLWALKSKSS